ncbi:MAG: hypothetical protein R3Y64_10550 [Peptostreptococcaceae bacterium]
MNNPNEYFKKGFNDFYRDYFGNNKDTNFMFKVKDEFFTLQRSRVIIDQSFNRPDFGINSFMVAMENPDFEIAKNIIMIFKENTNHLTNEEKLELRANKEYIKKLIDQVHTQLCIRKYGTELVRKDFYNQFAPSIYSLRALVAYTGELIRNKINSIQIDNKNFYYTMMVKIINKCVGCLTLMEINLHEEAFSQLRTLTELYLIYYILITKESKVIDTYDKHVKWGFEFNSTGEYPEELINKFNKLPKNIKCTINDYMNFGWLDEIIEYGYMENRRYKISDLAHLIDLKQTKGKRNTFGKDIYKIYKDCNPLTHGSTFILNNIEAEKVLIGNLGIVIHNIAYDTKSLTNDSYTVNTVNILDYFNYCREYNIMQFSKLTNKTKV